MHDLTIRRAHVIDGSGQPGFQADVAISDGQIVEVGAVTGPARRTIDADGALVTPAWIDIHTHYDGQVTWDSTLDPSASHGVGTIVMGNCGVGFAPVKPGGEQDLIDLMEGVEDIPGTALHEGMPWGEWETYPEYLDFLAGREYAINVSSLVAHGAVRNYVMGERGRNNEAATADDLARMRDVVEEALVAGSVGFSTSRIIGHRSIHGDPVPGTFANDDELMVVADALRRAGSGLLQIIPSSTLGPGREEALEHSSLESEIDLIARVSRESGRPATFTLFQMAHWPDKWREIVSRVERHNKNGAVIAPQVGARPVGLVMSLATYHPYALKPSYQALLHLPFDERVRAMRESDVKARILSEPNLVHEKPGGMENGVANIEPDYGQIFPLTSDSTYEPRAADSIAGRAAAAGVNDLDSFFYDYLTGDGGNRFAILFFANWNDYSLDAAREMQLSGTTVTGLSDAGAHVSVIFDAVNPTYTLTYWGRDRSRGDTLPLELLVHRQTQKNAALFGFDDRGLIAPGKRADLNVIDFDHLRLGELTLHHDLPSGGKRLLQQAEGYVANVIGGELTRENGVDTGARPGRLVRVR